MSDISRPHDSLFKEFLTDIDIARQFLDIHLPDHIKQRCDLQTLELVSGAFVGNELKQRFADIVYRVKVKGENRFLYILVEHQSAAERLLPFRIAHYEMDIMRQYCDQTKSETLPEIVSLVFYRGKTRYPYSLNVRDLLEYQDGQSVFAQQIPTLIGISALSDEEIQEHGNIAILEIVQKYVKEKDLQEFIQLVLIELTHHPLPTRRKNNLFRYLLSEGECSDFENFYRIVHSYNPTYGEEMMTVAEQLKQQGLEEAAVNMLQKHLSTDLIAEVTGFTKEKLIALAKRFNISLEPQAQ